MVSPTERARVAWERWIIRRLYGFQPERGQVAADHGALLWEPIHVNGQEGTLFVF